MRRERPTRDDDEDEPHVSLRDRMTRLDAELVEAREVLERVAPGEPRLLAPATVAEAFAMADAALAAKARENKHKKASGDDKAAEKDVPAWWRFVDPFFRELTARDFGSVLPFRRWDDDWDLKMPGFGRRWDTEFASRVPEPEKVTLASPTDPPPAAPIQATSQGNHALSQPKQNHGGPNPPPTTAPAHVPLSEWDPPAAVPHPADPGTTGLRSVPSVPAPPRGGGAAATCSLLPILTPDEVASLFELRVSFEDDQEAVKSNLNAAASLAGCDVETLEQWLSGPSSKDGRKETEPICAREEGDVASGLRAWLKNDAATFALEQRDARDATRVPVAPTTQPDKYARRHPFPPPTVCAVIKSDKDGVVYVAGEEVGAFGSTPPPIGTEGVTAAPGIGGGPASGGIAEAAPVIGTVVGGAARAAARAAAGSARSSPSVSGVPRAPSVGSLLGEFDSAEEAVAGPGPSSLNPDFVKLPPDATETAVAVLSPEEQARLATARRAFGTKGDLPHAFGPTRLDETSIPLHTQMLFDKHFWLAAAVGALPSATPQTPWQSPSPASRARDKEYAAAMDADAKKNGKKGQALTGSPKEKEKSAAHGRCSVCVVQKKGRCGADSAPARCLRRGSGGRGRVDALEDPFDESADEILPLSVPHVSKKSKKSLGETAGQETTGPPPVARSPHSHTARTQCYFSTPLPAASTAAISSMRLAERFAKRRSLADAKRAARESGQTVSSDDSYTSSSSSSESDDKPNSASAELAKLLSALDDEPALRAAAPSDEVEGETLALHYELMWQQQANRYVMTSLLGRVRDCVDGEGKRFAETQGDLAQAAAYMSKVREVRRILKREKRDADQRLALERAAAAAAGSTRVGAQRRDADGNVIAPAHGMDGVPEDVAAAAAAAAHANAGFGRALGVGPGGSPKTAAAAAAAAAAHAARYGMYHPSRYASGRPRIPKHVSDRFAAGVRIGNPMRTESGFGPPVGGETLLVAGTAVPGTTTASTPVGSSSGQGSPGFFPGVGLGASIPGGVPPAAPSRAAPTAGPGPTRFGPPETLVDTIHAAAHLGSDKKSGGASSGKSKNPPNHENSPTECAVCAGTAEAQTCVETLRCARCALPTHPKCYGVKNVAAGVAACALAWKEKDGKKKDGNHWLCWVCRDATERGKANTPAVAAAAATTPPGVGRPSLEEKLAMFRGISCVLCPVQLGAFKQCQDGRWCHVACALWMPETQVEDSDVVRAVRGVQNIPKDRSRHNCVACGRAGGVSVRCSFGHCQISFHPLCARRAGYHVRASDGNRANHRAYCDKHSPAAAERDRRNGVVGPAIPTVPGGTVVASKPRQTQNDDDHGSSFPSGFDVGLTRVAQGGQLPVDTRAVSSFPNTTGGTGCALDELEGPSPTALLLETVEALSLKARALRRARGELIKAQALFRAVLRRETVKRGVTRVAVAIKGHGGVTGGASAAGEGSPGGAAAAAGQSVATPAGAPGGAPPVKSERSVGVVRHVPLSSSAVGPSGVTPVAPKRARSQSARGRGNTGGGGGPGPGTTDGGGTVRDGFGTVRDGGGTVRDDGGTVRDGGAPNAKRARLPGSDRGGDSELPKGWGAR